VLNFSKINIFIIYLIFIFVSFFSILNFQDPDNQFIEKKVNLGLDLQGGSYLLLEINSDSLVQEKIQSKVIPIKKLLKDNGVIIVHRHKKENDYFSENFKIFEIKKYGISKIIFGTLI